MKNVISAGQARAARALIGWSREALAAAAGATVRTVARFELEEGPARPATLSAIRAALEAAGVIFLDEGETPDGGPGVRLNRTGDVPPQTHGIEENGGGPGVRLAKR